MEIGDLVTVAHRLTVIFEWTEDAHLTFGEGDTAIIVKDHEGNVISVKKKCRVVIPGLGECECPEHEHKLDGNGQPVHVHGACSWNGGNLIEIHDNGMEITGRLRIEDV